MPFNEIVGQDKALKTIHNALIHKTLPHAYLFYGAKGVGKYTTAISLAKAIACGEQEADFCGSCSSCRRIEDGNHPDVYVIRPVITRSGGEWVHDPENGMILIDQIREIQRRISLRSFEGGYKVAILDGAERMSPSAANSLLRMLEEPPGETLLILISPTKSHLLPTIVSRCQKIPYPPLSREVLQKMLKERYGWEEAHSALVAGLAGGSVGKSIAMDTEWVCTERRQWIERLIHIEEGKLEEGISSLAEGMSRSPVLEDIMETYSTWYRDLLIFIETGESLRLLNSDMGEHIALCSPKRKAEDYITRIQHIQKARKDIEDIAVRVNHRLVLEDLLLKLQYDPAP